MPILMKMNLHCNFACKYCYENPIKPGFMEDIDLDAAEATVRKLFKEAKDKGGTPSVTLHGGECTTYPKKDIRRLLSLCHELTGRSGIQTNAYLIDDDMIEMFKTYNTGIGISIDGPWPLNELRGFGNREDRIRQTSEILSKIDRMKEMGLRLSVIAVLHRYNAVGERREMLKQWVRDLSSKGITGRLNPCCSGNPDIDLTPEEAVEAYTDIYSFMAEEGITGWSPFRDIMNSLQGKQEVVCVFRECDPFCTHSAHTILKDGSSAVCLRLYISEDGRKYLRDTRRTGLRGNILSQTDCKDCEWWEYCRGGCSGLAIDWDWRNKDRYCLMYKALFRRTSNAMKAMGMKPCPPSSASRPTSSGRGHWDGVEHIDGEERHLDSDAPPQGTSGRSDVYDKAWKKYGGKDYTDGLVHLDGQNLHQDGDYHEDTLGGAHEDTPFRHKDSEGVGK